MGDYDLSALGEVLSIEHPKLVLRVPKNETAAVASRLLTDLSVFDLTIEDPPIEDIISRVFGGEARAADGGTVDAEARTPSDDEALTP